MNTLPLLSHGSLTFTIDQMYPELLYVTPAEYPYAEALAYFELGYQLALNVLSWQLGRDLQQFRLTEFMFYSQYKPEQLLDKHAQWHTQTLELASQCFSWAQLSPPLEPIASFNQHVLKLLQADSHDTRLEWFGVLDQHLSRWESSASAEQWSLMLRCWNHLRALNPKEPLGQQVSRPILVNESLQLLPSTRISAQERALAMALRWQLNPGMENSPCRQTPPRPDYHQVNWRQPLVQWLWEAEYPAFKQPVRLGCEHTFASVWKHAAAWEVHDINTTHGLGQALDVITLWDLATLEAHTVQEALHQLRPGGMLVVAVPRTTHEPEAIRLHMEELTHSTCYLVDREGFRDVLIAYVIKGHYFKPVLRVMILMRPDSILTFGGADLQMMRSRAYFKQYGIRSDISLGLRLEAANYEVVYVVGYLHENYKFHWLNQVALPKIIMPIMSLYQNSMIQFEQLYRKLKPTLKSGTPEEILNLWQYLVAQELGPEHPPVNLHNDNTFEAQLYRDLRQVGDFFVFQSEAEIPVWWGTKATDSMPYQVIPNGCYSEMITSVSPTLFESTYPLRDFVLCIGRLDDNKNQALVCDALKDTDIPIVLVGKESDHADRQRLFHLLNPNVHMLENLSTEMLYSAMKCARLLVVPSANEVSPLITLEAAWARCPIVLTRYTLQADWFGEGCYVCDPLNPSQFKEVLLNACQADHAPKVQHAWERVQNCTWEQVALQLITVFEQFRYQNEIAHPKWWQGKLYAYCRDVTDIALTKPWPHYFELTTLLPLLSLEPPLKQHLQAQGSLVVAFSAWAKGHLRQFGWTSIQPESYLKDNLLTYIAQPVELDDMQSLNLLCIYDQDNQTGWQESLQAYLNLFKPSDDVGLFIYIKPDEDMENIETNLLQVIGELGYDPENIPALVILNDSFSSFELLNVLATMDGLLLPLHQFEKYQLWLEMAALTPIHIISHDFGLWDHRQAFTTLSTLDELLGISPQEPIPINPERLQSALLELRNKKAKG